MKVLISNEEIVEISKKIGAKLSEKFAGKFPVVVCVLKGAAPFHAELVKHISIDMEVDYIQVSSYIGKESTGVITFKKDLEVDITGRDVIIVEDIVDTGTTLNALTTELSKRNPNSLTFVSLLDKPSRRKMEAKADYVGKTIDDLFVIGFGLDLDQKYRNLKDVYIYDED
ncbi:MAG: hypoxanthine phosphoribosyltransferase [Clostridia bacterium]|nr:hypoxanthine phosphoribosyltransferase [Clostridia bacterium]